MGIEMFAVRFGVDIGFCFNIKKDDFKRKLIEYVPIKKTSVIFFSFHR